MIHPKPISSELQIMVLQHQSFKTTANAATIATNSQSERQQRKRDEEIEMKLVAKKKIPAIIQYHFIIHLFTI